MSELKKQVQDWIDAGKDYNEGLNLLTKNSKNKAMARILSMNPNPSKADKILYELLKLAGMKDDYVQQSAIINNVVQPSVIINRPERKKDKIPAVKIVQATDPIKHSKPFNKLPLIIQEVIKQKGGLYRTREQLHAKISDENQLSNKPEYVKKRKPILDKIEHISKRIDELYEAEKDFKENGTLPSEDLLNWDTDTKQEVKKTIPNSSKLSDLELKNRLTNLKTYLTKETNQLRFQTKSVQQEENPMPNGPKRDALENKIAMRKVEMEVIEIELKARAGKSKGHKGK
jgi:phage host-nuclease inhibitor protein Gam